MAYFGRQVLVTMFGFGANVVLLRLLLPADFGVFAIVTLVMSLLGVLADGGMNVYLIQNQQVENEGSILSLFLSNQLLIYGIIHLLFSLVICGMFILDHSPMLLLYLWAAALSTIPSLFRGAGFVILERQLNMVKVAVIETSEALAYSVSSVLLALVGAGVWSIIIALSIKALVGCLLALKYSGFSYKPVRPQWNSNVAKAVGFGLHYHAGTVMAVVRGMAGPMIAGPLLGLAAVGILDRSGYIAYIPLMLIGTVQGRVLFPYYAKMQDDVARTARVLKKCIYVSGVLDKLIYVPIFLLSPCLPRIMGDKWTPAVALIQITSLGHMTFGAIVTSLSPMIAGMGKARWISALSWIPVVIMYVLIWPMAVYFGLKGVAWVNVIIWLGGLVAIYLVKREWPQIKMWKAWFGPVLAGFVALGGTIALFPNYRSMSWSALAGINVIAVGGFLLTLWVITPEMLVGEIADIRIKIGTR